MLSSELALPKEFVDCLGIEKLNPPQEAAIKSGLLEKKNMVIATPTASGKTAIAEIAMLRHFSDGGKTVYLVPLKALASEKYREFKEKYSKLGMRIAISVGDLDSSDEWLGGYDLIIVSNEKMDSILRHGATWTRDITLVVADEIHLLDDISRGPTLEIVLTRLRDITNSQILALSATISNAEEIAEWLDAKLVRSDYRPIKLYHGVFYPYMLEIDGKERREIAGSDDLEVILSKDVLKMGKQALVFVSTRRSAEATAEKIADKIEKLLDIGEKSELKKIAKGVEASLSIATKQCKREARIVSKGAAFHHAGLVAKQRELIEEGFRRGVIKVLAATPTLAFGINLPAYRVLIRDAKRYGSYGSEFIPVFEVQQMCGRAGRPRYDKEGEAILIAKTANEAGELKKRYIDGEPEPIYSKLSMESTLRMHVLALIAASVTKTRNELEKFFSRTFFAHQYRNLEEVMEKIEKILKDLERYSFIKIGKGSFIADEFVAAFDLSMDVGLEPTKIGKRVAELYIDPASANHIIQNMKTKTDIEHLLVINQCIEMRPLFGVKSKDYERVEDELARSGITTPDVWDIEYDEFLKSFKASLMFRDWMDEIGEDRLLDIYGIAPGELYTKLKNAEWVFYSASELAKLLNNKDMANDMNRLKLRIKHGVKEELLSLVRIRGIGRVRARMLWKNRIRSIGDIRKTNDRLLAELLGPKVAENIKTEADKPLRKIAR